MEEIELLLSSTYSPPYYKVKIIPKVTNQLLSCYLEKSVLLSLQGRKKKKEVYPSVLAESARTHALTVYTQHVCLNLNKFLLSPEYSTFHAQRNETPSWEGSGGCAKVTSSLDEDYRCFERKRPEVAHLGSQNQSVTLLQASDVFWCWRNNLSGSTGL